MQILINSVDQTSKTDRSSFEVEQVLTQEVDTMRLTLVAPDTIPVLADEVIVYDGDSNKIFAGILVGIEIRTAQNVVVYDLTFKDYTELMDGRLVIDSFDDQMTSDIIDAIVAEYLPAGFTVDCDLDVSVGYVAFNFEKPSRCMARLAELVGGDWYVDYDKVIHFFRSADISAPWVITDTNGKIQVDTLKIKNDLSQIRNIIYVRGGEYQGDAYTETQKADGKKTTFVSAYKYANITVTKGGAAQTVGIDFIDDPTSKDCLYNFNEKAVKFPTAPADGVEIAIGGNPYIPVYIKAKNDASIDEYGEREFKIVDSSIKTKQGARDRAKAELDAYKAQINDGTFSTFESGLRTGQTININSASRGINDNFIISRLRIAADSDTLFRYEAELVSFKSYGILTFLQQLLDRTEVGENKGDEVLDKIITVDEAVTASDSVVVVDPVDIVEAATAADEITVQDPDYDVQFVLGPQLPSTTKRVFNLNGSKLA